MAKLTWDESGKRLYETGISNGVLFVSDGSTGYKQGVAWNGLTAVTESPEGAEPTDIFADNMKYLTLRSAETLSGTIEAYTYPDEFMDCDGSKTAGEVKGLTFGQQARMPFGLAYVTKIGNDLKGDDFGKKLHLVYGASASPSERAYNTTNDSPEATPLSWEFTTIPVVVAEAGMKATSLVVVDSTKCSPEQWKAITDKVFGDTMSESELPTPDEVIALMKEAAAA